MAEAQAAGAEEVRALPPRRSRPSGFRVLRRESLPWDVVVMVVARVPAAAEAAA